jgi:hypothetical protein
LNCKEKKCKAEENKTVSSFQDEGLEIARKTFELVVKGAEIMYYVWKVKEQRMA